jgi:hypothetical protein
MAYYKIINIIGGTTPCGGPAARAPGSPCWTWWSTTGRALSGLRPSSQGWVSGGPGRDPPTAKQSSLILQQAQDSLKKNKCKKSSGANSSYNISNSMVYSTNTGKHEQYGQAAIVVVLAKDGTLSTVKTRGSSQTSKQGTSNII